MGAAQATRSRIWIILMLGMGLLLVMSGSDRAEGSPSKQASLKAIQFAEATWTEEFAGAWLDFDHPRSSEDGRGGWIPDRKVFFAFTGGAEAKTAELRNRFPASNPFVAVTHAHSLATLIELQGRVTGDLRSYAAGTLAIPGPEFKWHSTDIWVVDNQVEVNLSMVTRPYLTWAADRYGELFSALRIYAGGRPTPESGRPGKKCDRRCHKAKARKRALKRKCMRAARVAKKTGSPKAKRLARSKPCRALRK